VLHSNYALLKVNILVFFVSKIASESLLWETLIHLLRCCSSMSILRKSGFLVIVVGVLFFVSYVLCMLSMKMESYTIFNVTVLILAIVSIVVAVFLDRIRENYHEYFFKYAANLFGAGGSMSLIGVGLSAYAILVEGSGSPSDLKMVGLIPLVIFTAFFVFGLPFFGKAIRNLARRVYSKVPRVLGTVALLEPLIVVVLFVVGVQIGLSFDLMFFVGMPLIVSASIISGGVALILCADSFS